MKDMYSSLLSRINTWQELSSAMRTYWLVSAAAGLFMALVFTVFVQQNHYRQDVLSTLKGEAIMARLDNTLTRLSFAISAAVKDPALARMPVDIMFFQHANALLQELVAYDEAIVGAFVMDDSDFVLEGVPTTVLGIRSKHLAAETQRLISQEGLVNAKPALYLFPRDHAEFVLPIKSEASSWLVFGAPLIMARNNYAMPYQKTGVLWVVIDIVALLSPMLEKSDLVLQGLEAHGVAMVGEIGAGDVDLTPKTPIYYRNEFARLHIYLNSVDEGNGWVLYPWSLVFFIVVMLLILFWFVKKEEQRTLQQVAAMPNIDKGCKDPLLLAVRSRIESLIDNKQYAQVQQIQEKNQVIAREARESSFRQAAKALQNRIDEPLMQLSLASSVLHQYSSDRALFPVLQDIQQALESLQRNSQYLQASLMGDVSLFTIKPAELKLEQLLFDFYRQSQKKGLEVKFDVDPLLHSRVLLLAEALLQALLAIARSRPVQAFGQSCGVSLTLRQTHGHQQLVRFIVYNDLYQLEQKNLVLPEFSERDEGSLTKLVDSNDLDLRLANAYCRIMQAHMGVLETDKMGTLVYFDIPIHVIDDDPVMSNLHMNLARLIRNKSHDK